MPHGRLRSRSCLAHLARQLKPNPTKTVVGYFHLANRKAHEKLEVKLEGTVIKHEACPVYLGVTLDCSLSYKQHYEKISKKVGTHNNIIRKLAGSMWGAIADTLCRSSLALVYSAAEYATSTWGSSRHAKKVDNALNTTMRTITATLKSTSVVCKLLDLGHAVLGHAELGQRFWDMRNWDSGSGTCGTGTAFLGHAELGQFL